MISKVKIKNSISHVEELNDIFHQFMGGDDMHPLDIDLVFPMLEEMIKIFQDAIKILSCFIKSFDSENDLLLKNSIKEIIFFNDELRNFCKQNPVLNPPSKKKNLTMSDISTNNLYSEEDKKLITALYNKYKNSEYTNSLLEYVNRVHMHAKIFNDLSWVNTIPGDYYEIFPFSSLNIKYLINILSDSKEQSYHEFLYKLLKKLYDKSKRLYEIIITPTIDINVLSDLLLENIPIFRKEVSRCDRAFDKIENSLKILKNKFPEYYKNYAMTNDFGIVIQNFVNDLYEDNKNDPILISQLRRIIEHFSSKIKNHKNSNIKINNLVDKLTNILH